MISKISVFLVFLLSQVQPVFTASKVKILSTRGEVRVRRGVEESWHPASSGTFLDDIDSILTGERGQVSLQVQDGKMFKLGSNATLDIADLRRISERELFLFLMSRKINRLERRKDKTRLRIGNVNVVHAERKTDSTETDDEEDQLNEWIRERNGARALHTQDFITNAVMKMNKILQKHSEISDCGEIHYYLGEAFEELGKPGQASNAYAQVQTRSQVVGCDPSDNIWLRRAMQAATRISRQ